MAQQTDHIGDTNKMVTAVDWLIKRYQDYGTLYYEDMTKAKAMEKEQIKFAYNDGADAIVANKYKAMEDYYNELYQSSQDKTDK